MFLLGCGGDQILVAALVHVGFMGYAALFQVVAPAAAFCQFATQLVAAEAAKSAAHQNGNADCAQHRN